MSHGQEFETPAEAMHNAICCFMFDIGTQVRHFTKNGVRTPNNVKQVVVGYELEQKRTEGNFAGQPFVHYEFYTNSVSANSFLCKAYNAMNPNNKITKEMRDPKLNPNGVDIEICIGKRITLNLIKNDYNGKMKIDSVMPASQTSNMVVTQNKIPDWVYKLKNNSPNFSTGQNIPTPQPQQFQQQQTPVPYQQQQYQQPGPNQQYQQPNPQQVTHPTANSVPAPVTYSNQQQYVPPPNQQQNQVIQPPPPIVEDDLPF
jgi:hypothetical protein